MHVHRFYCNKITEPITEVTDSEAHHIASVMRLTKGQKVELFDGRGILASGVIAKADNRKVVVAIEQLKTHEKPKKPQVTVAASIAKGERFDWLMAKCTELGLDRIVPVIFERTIKQPKNPKVLDRWNNIAISSCKQCRRLFLPQISGPLKLVDAIEGNSEAKLLVGSVDAQAQPLVNIEMTGSDVVAFVGPEGGLAEDEMQLFSEHDAKPVRLADTVLRIETAAVAFASILAARRDAAAQTR